MFNWKTTYTDADFSTELKVISTIDIETGIVSFEIDASALPSSISEVVVMNEQGAHHFDIYQDSCGVFLQGPEIGHWDEVHAEEAWFENSTRRIAFRLSQVKGARLFRGRELVDSRLAWAGFGYSFAPSIKRFRYKLKIERLT